MTKAFCCMCRCLLGAWVATMLVIPVTLVLMVIA
jgi:hypothetical protein